MFKVIVFMLELYEKILGIIYVKKYYYTPSVDLWE